MSLNATPSAERLHIGIFGRRNVGKSSIINAITGQNLAIVSDVKGTTTDPVLKSMELLPIGPVVMIDTPGLDDEGELGELRIKKSFQMLNKTDVGLLIIDGTLQLNHIELEIMNRFAEKNIPYIVAVNKADLMDRSTKEALKSALTLVKHVMYVSALTNHNIFELKELIGRVGEKEQREGYLIRDMLKPRDVVVLVIPIDKAAPKGRLILPEQQTIRDILDGHAITIVTQDNNLEATLNILREPPKMVVTDSQVFGKVAQITPESISLTSFSILFARYKGDLGALIDGAAKLKHLQGGERILISEGCTHHRQCGDIGSEKLPNWIREYTGKDFIFEFTSGVEFPEKILNYDLVVHCGGCMLNEREMKYRIACAKDAGIPITNYGVSIALMHGILERTIQVFPDLLAKLKKEQ